jgi:DNA-binding NarL/FixJ family response regulator
MQRILIADDHPLFRQAMREIVTDVFTRRGGPFTCLEAADTGAMFQAAAATDELDLVLLDLFMPGSSGLADLVALRNCVPATPIVVVTSLDDPATVQRALACGAAGYIVKSASKDVMIGALQIVLGGGTYTPNGTVPRQPAPGAAAEDTLTPRQLAVLALLANGSSNKQIARDLDISDVTVKAHMTAILRKLGVATRSQAIVAFQRDRLGHEQPAL